MNCGNKSMNEKSLNRQELDYLFEKYADVPNINEIKFMGKIASGLEGKMDNPHYYNITPKEGNGHPFMTARMMTELVSPNRISTKGNHYITRIPVFTSDRYAIEFQERMNEPMDYVMGIGHLQNYKVVQKHQITLDDLGFLKDMLDRMGETDLQKAYDIARILHIQVDDRNRSYMTLTNIWCNNTEKGDELAQQMIDDGELPQVNDARVQGLVYMPPSIRELHSDEAYSLHFKMRIKRHKEDNQEVPTLHQADYDFLNVICFGQKAVKWFGEVKQGHPVKVHGRIESSKFKKVRRITAQQVSEVARYLGVGVDNPCVMEIKRYFDSKNENIEYPNFNIWADDVVTDESQMDAK